MSSGTSKFLCLEFSHQFSVGVAVFDCQVYVLVLCLSRTVRVRVTWGEEESQPWGQHGNMSHISWGGQNMGIPRKMINGESILNSMAGL